MAANGDSAQERSVQEANSARLSSLVLSLTNDDSVELARVDNALLSEAQLDAHLLAQVAAPNLNSDQPLTRSAAALALGRAAEFGDDVLLSQIESALLARLRIEESDGALERIATALLHVWGRRDDHRMELKLAADSDYRCRLVAAKAMALTDPYATPAVEAALRKLAADADERVRSWALFGLGDR